MSSEEEDRRTLLACKFGGSVAILLAAGWCALQHQHLLDCIDYADNTVSGGQAMLPRVSRLMFECEKAANILAWLFAVGSLILLWIKSRSISQTIYITALGAGLILATALLFEAAYSFPSYQSQRYIITSNGPFR